MPSILIVGAGFAGAVYARTLAEAGFSVHVIDRRDHIAGNAADWVDGNGVRVHRYGPHLFHTNATAVFTWLQRFGGWTPYLHRVLAILPNGRFAPLPVNDRDQPRHVVIASRHDHPPLPSPASRSGRSYRFLALPDNSVRPMIITSGLPSGIDRTTLPDTRRAVSVQLMGALGD